MKKRNRKGGRGPVESSTGVAGRKRGWRKRRAWTFERLEERHFLSATPLQNVEWQSLSNDTLAGALELLAREQLWSQLMAGGGDGTVLLQSRALPNDPYFDFQWHLWNTGQIVGTPLYQDIRAVPGEDINVLPAWEAGYTGAGVVVAVVDSGIQLDHPDLVGNIDLLLSRDILRNLPGGGPGNAEGDAHGTAAAGLIAAIANNGIGMTGVAPDATLAALRILSGDPLSPALTDQAVANALSWANQEIDIYNHSWGPPGRITRPIEPLSLDALIFSVTHGRGGLGNIHVFAAGNEAGPSFVEGFDPVGIWNSADWDMYVNTRYTIGVTAVDHDGQASNLNDGTITNYAQAGTSVLLAAPSGTNLIDVVNDLDTGSGLWTTDLTGENGYNFSPLPSGFELDGDYFPDVDYTSRFGGTSAAAPLVSGVIALMLQANPNLNWRDVQEILVRSSRQNVPNEIPQTGFGLIGQNSWIVNQNQIFRNPDPYVPPIPEDPETGDPAVPGTDPFQAVFSPAPTLLQPPTPLMFTNGAGYTVSLGRDPYMAQYGYGHGVVDAALAVNMARQWHVRGQNLPPEKTFTTYVVPFGNLDIPAAETADLGDFSNVDFLIPGAAGGDSGFADYWEEYFEEDDPEDDEDGPFSGDDPPINTRGTYIALNIPDEHAMAVEWVEVKLSMSGPANGHDFLRVSLVSPDGTHSDLSGSIFVDQGFLPYLTQPDTFGGNISLFTDPPGALDPDGGNFVWTYTTNRHWGERTTLGVPFDPVTDEPFFVEMEIPPLDPEGEPTIQRTLAFSQGWQLHFENWGSDDFEVEGLEVAFHGRPINAQSQRIQGFVGIDSGVPGEPGFDQPDGQFNFNRYIQTEPFFFPGPFGSSGQVSRTADPFQEPFASNVLVTARRVSDNAIVGRFLTGADGNFYFDLVPDDYIISISDPLGREALDEQGVPRAYLPHFQKEWRITPEFFFAPERDLVSFPFAPHEFRTVIDEDGNPVAFRTAIGEFDDDLDPETPPVPFFSSPIPSAVKNINFLLDPGPQPSSEVTISGHAFADLNADGVFNNDDPWGVGYIIYADLNDSGQFEGAEPFTVVGLDGSYTLTVDVATPQRFKVRAVPPNSTWTATTPEGAMYEFFASPGATFTNQDFGFAPPATQMDDPFAADDLGSIMGVVYNDRNGNGQRQAGEGGISGLRVFVDSNGNGVWNDGELYGRTNVHGAYFIADVAPGVSRILVEIASPLAVTEPAIGFRDVLLPAQGALTGVRFGVFNGAFRDFGDLAGYPTLLSENGARHDIVEGFHLGTKVDGELDGQPTADATGDDAIGGDEDGIRIVDIFGQPGAVLRPGESAIIEVTVAGVGGYLNGWIDFNNDGDWTDPGEQIFVNVDLNPGTHLLTADVPLGIAPGPLAARFRWGPAGLSFIGPASVGEVEDYRLPTSVAPAVVPVLAGDFNGDGIVDQADYTVWKSTFGSSSDLRADANRDGLVDSADYSIWRDNLGAVSATGSSSLASGSGATAAAELAELRAAAYAAYLELVTQSLGAGLSPGVIANMERLGAIPQTIVAPDGSTKTVFYLPTANASQTAGGSAIIPLSGVGSNGTSPTDVVPPTATSGFSTLYVATGPESAVSGRLAYAPPAARPFENRLELLDQVLAGMVDHGEQSRVGDDLVGRSSEEDEAVEELAVAAAFGDEGDWWRLG